jgi:phenylpropionate dioxygenase-like ring-hydroxylating dioxygenase large terminal subunit
VPSPQTRTVAPCDDPVINDLWHPVGAVAELTAATPASTMLLGRPISVGIDGQGHPIVVADGGDELAARVEYGYVWACPGRPPAAVFPIPEALEPDRRVLNGGSIMVATSAPRAVENFLDMGHFPYVHTGILGEEPRTEVVDYRAEVEDGEVWARDCQFYQPVAAASAASGQMTDYTYRVPHPYCVLLYKTVPTDPSRRDVIGLFVQAMTDETIRAHNFLCMVDDVTTDTGLRRFQQMIFSQDKPILENQYPKRLPLDPRVETPIRADRSAIVYRRWLQELGVTYSVIPAA